MKKGSSKINKNKYYSLEYIYKFKNSLSLVDNLKLAYESYNKDIISKLSKNCIIYTMLYYEINKCKTSISGPQRHNKSDNLYNVLLAYSNKYNKDYYIIQIIFNYSIFKNPIN